MITVQGATQLVGILVVTTTGWNDDSVEATIMLIHTKWSDGEAASEAVDQVANSWTKQSRPPWAVMNGAYNDARRRRALSTPALRSAGSGEILTMKEGREVATRAYIAEMRRQGREPNQSTIDSFLGIVTES